MVSNVAPKRGGLCGGRTARADLKGCAPVRHRSRVINTVMHDGLENLAVFGERGDCLHGDTGVALSLGQDENEGCAGLLDEVQCRTQRPEVVGARACRYQN